MFTRAYLLAFWLALPAHPQTNLPPANGATLIAGDVMTYEGRPAAGYLVDVVGASRSSTPGLRILTNENGLFEAQGLSLGEYVLVPYLEDVDSRYPAGASTFYSPHPYRLTLTASAPSQHVSLHLGPPNRVLSGQITSKTSQSPVTAVIQIEYPEEPDRFIRFSSSKVGVYRVLIPALTRLKITISAPGYVTISTFIDPVDKDKDPRLDYELTRTGDNVPEGR